jgi:hypothetical protein
MRSFRVLYSPYLVGEICVSDNRFKEITGLIRLDPTLRNLVGMHMI